MHFSVFVEAHPNFKVNRDFIQQLIYNDLQKKRLSENLKIRKVIEIRRIIMRKNEQILSTKHIIFTDKKLKRYN